MSFRDQKHYSSSSSSSSSSESLSFLSSLSSPSSSSSSSSGSSPSIKKLRAIAIFSSLIKSIVLAAMASANNLRAATRSFDLIASIKPSIKNPLVLGRGLGNEPL
ncbi:hypothetical protein vBEcoMWL3_gp165c [Escherichia phage vB_EcoM_WL-3]|nr:hypothetical protein vBEcoMWL3_gp165c [Escherichia phage vB_EcoM_WL-3]